MGMKVTVFLGWLLGCVFTALAAEITGAFGIKIGEAVSSERIVSASTNGLIVITEFKPERPYSDLTRYHCATGPDGKVALISADKVFPSENAAEDAFDVLVASLGEKYGTPKKEGFPKGATWTEGHRAIMVTLRADPKRAGHVLNLIYTDNLAAEKLLAEDRADRAARVEKSGL